MITGLNPNETAAYYHLTRAPRSIVTLAMAETKTPDTFRSYLAGLLEAWRDNPRNMLNALGFNLPAILNMKFYNLEQINDRLADRRFAFRVLSETTATTKDAVWVALADYFQADQIVGTVYIDSSLNRYVRLANGQLFHCSNADLLGMPEIDRVNIRAYLLGIID